MPVPSESEILDALRPVVEPELDRSIVELGMVRRVTEKRGSVDLDVSVPIEGHPEIAELESAIQRALAGVSGVKKINARFTPMTEDEQRAVSDLLRHGPDDHAGHGDHAGHSHAKTNPFTDSRTRVIAVSSGKGGVGKSSVTTNLSVALAQRGHKVAALDADVWGFSMPRMLGIDRPPALVGELIIPPRAHGVRLISMGFFTDEDQPVIWRGPMLHKALEQFLTDVWWGEPDFLVIDMPPGTGDISLSMAQFLPRAEVVIVTTPQVAAQRVAQRAAGMADKVRLSVVGVIENMSWFRGDDGKRYEIFGAGGGEELAANLGVELLGKVPLLPELRAGGDTGRPIIVADPSSEAASVFGSIADRL
ncbi:MAG TPA: Mrp/NBP35 family ATP-binding protein, partial [Acidimicrobiia bacterium]|nr:Mrp/NBP35 family ATP-binding protein [Acidimicrobiia bacterium]